MTAPAFRAGGTDVVTVTAGADITPGAPAGAADGDILILVCGGRVDDDATHHFNITANGTGWTEIAEHYTDIGTTSLQLRAWWYRVSGSVPTMPSFDHPSANFGGVGGRIYAYSGCIATGTPYEDPATVSGNASAFVGVDVTTTGADRRVVQFWWADDDTTGNPAASWTEDSELTGTSTIQRVNIADSIVQASAGTVSAPTRSNGNERNVCIGFALIPADGSINGTLSKTLDNVTSSATGTLPLVGTLDKTLAALTSSATGTLPLVGTLDKTLGDLTLAATIAHHTYGVTDATLADLTCSSAGVLALKGTLSKTLDDVTCAATGVITLSGVVSVTLGAVTLSAAGTLPLVGTLAKTLGDVTSVATGTISITGVLNKTLGDLTLSAEGTIGGIVTTPSEYVIRFRRRRRMYLRA